MAKMPEFFVTCTRCSYTDDILKFKLDITYYQDEELNDIILKCPECGQELDIYEADNGN